VPVSASILAITGIYRQNTGDLHSINHVQEPGNISRDPDPSHTHVIFLVTEGNTAPVNSPPYLV